MSWWSGWARCCGGSTECAAGSRADGDSLMLETGWNVAGNRLAGF